MKVTVANEAFQCDQPRRKGRGIAVNGDLSVTVIEPDPTSEDRDNRVDKLRECGGAFEHLVRLFGRIWEI